VIIAFTEDGWEDYQHWQRENRSVLARLNRLITDAQRHPTSGIGKPEPLKWDLSGAWSRRITDEHRLVYRQKGDALVILACRQHYGK
jgi:toxin YoeB